MPIIGLLPWYVWGYSDLLTLEWRPITQERVHANLVKLWIQEMEVTGKHWAKCQEGEVNMTCSGLEFRNPSWIRLASHFFSCIRKKSLYEIGRVQIIFTHDYHRQPWLLCSPIFLLHDSNVIGFVSCRQQDPITCPKYMAEALNSVLDFILSCIKIWHFLASTPATPYGLFPSPGILQLST